MNDSERRAKYDLSLLQNISKGNVAALMDCYDRHSTLMYSIIYRIVDDKTVADNIIQEVFSALWNNAVSYDTQFRNPTAWLSRIARDYAVNYVRTHQTDASGLALAPESYHEMFATHYSDNPEHRMILSSQQEEILIALTSLSTEQKEIIEYAYFRGFTLSELPDVLNLSMDIVKSRMRSTVSTLRQKLHHFIP